MITETRLPVPSRADDWDSHWPELTVINQMTPGVKYRWRLIRNLLNFPAFKKPIRFLDIGCGEGSVAADLAKRYPNVSIAGIDGSGTGVQMARQRLPHGKFEKMDLSLPDSCRAAELEGWATHALCSEVLEHMDDPVGLLRTSKRFLAPGASLVITVPGGPMSSLDHHVGHRKHYTPALLHRELVDAGFLVDGVWRAGFPFYNLYRLTLIMRGKAVVEDSTKPASMSFLARVAMKLFHGLFYLNLPSTPFGWFVLGRATVPA